MQLKIDGKRAFVATGGRPLNHERPSIVFVHGAGLDHSVWPLPMRHFRRHGRNVLGVDLPGHGRSAGPALDSIAAMADWVAAALETTKIEQAAIVGHSMGSLVALETAARHPSRTRALAMLGTATPMPVHEQLLAAAQANDYRALDMLSLWGHAYAGQIGGFGAPGMWKTGGHLRLLEQAAPGVIYADLKACNDYGDGLANAGRVTCPTLLIIADHDLMTPAKAAKALAVAIPQSRVVEIQNCGHAMLTEQPNSVLDALIEIL
ncbi:MAG: alpha/beta fold hydrolase [Acidiferrobacterales bacterium]